MLFSYVSRLVNSLLPGEAAKASMEMKRWNRMIPSFWGFDIPYFHHHLHRTPRLERPSAPEMPTNQCYKGRKCSPPLAPQRSASIQRGREEDYTPENYNNMLAINDSKPSWLYNMPKKTHLLSSKPSSSDELGKWCGPLAELHGRFFFSPFRVSWIPSIFFQKEQPVLEWLTWKSIVTQSSLVLALPANGKLWQKMLDQHLQTCKGQLSNIFKWFNYVKITEEKNGYFDFQGSMDVLFKLKRRSISGW